MRGHPRSFDLVRKTAIELLSSGFNRITSRTIAEAIKEKGYRNVPNPADMGKHFKKLTGMEILRVLRRDHGKGAEYGRGRLFFANRSTIE